VSSDAAIGAPDVRGREAEHPHQVPAKGWWDVAMRTKVEAKDDRVTLLSAGVAFYALLALVPALVALVSIYGLVADPSEVDEQVRDLLGAAPSEVREMISSQLSSITEEGSTGLGWAVVIGIVVALWSASSGVNNLIVAINAAYDEDDTRGFVKRRGLALLLTIGAIVFLVVAFAVIALLPSMLADTGVGDAGRLAAGVLRWVLLFAGMLVALAILYRYSPDRDEPRWSWVTPGAILATVLWLVGSALFAFYAANFGKYNETYGSLGAVVVVMLWLFLTALAVILGAELNAELERQTARDTTKGPEVEMGERRATAADTHGPTAEELRTSRS
jgi:membrane protein